MTTKELASAGKLGNVYGKDGDFRSSPAAGLVREVAASYAGDRGLVAGYTVLSLADRISYSRPARGESATSRPDQDPSGGP
jgi:hypothetical protein